MSLEKKLSQAEILARRESWFDLEKWLEYKGEVLHGFSDEYAEHTLDDIVADFKMFLDYS